MNMSFCAEVDWVKHGSITKRPLTPSLSRFKKAPLFFVGAFTAFLLSGNIVGIASLSSMALIISHTELSMKAPFKACLLEACTTEE